MASGCNARGFTPCLIAFLVSCAMDGATLGASDANGSTAPNPSAGQPQLLVLRVSADALDRLASGGATDNSPTLDDDASDALATSALAATMVPAWAFYRDPASLMAGIVEQLTRTKLGRSEAFIILARNTWGLEPGPQYRAVVSGTPIDIAALLGQELAMRDGVGYRLRRAVVDHAPDGIKSTDNGDYFHAATLRHVLEGYWEQPGQPIIQIIRPLSPPYEESRWFEMLRFEHVLARLYGPASTQQVQALVNAVHREFAERR